MTENNPPEDRPSSGPGPYLHDARMPIPAKTLNWRGNGSWNIEHQMVTAKVPDERGKMRDQRQRRHVGDNMVWSSENSEAFIYKAADLLRDLGLGEQGLRHALGWLVERHVEGPRPLGTIDEATWDAVTWSVRPGRRYTHAVPDFHQYSVLIADALEARGIDLAANERGLCAMVSRDGGESWVRGDDAEMAYLRDDVVNNTVVVPDLAWVETWDDEMRRAVPGSGRMEWVGQPEELSKRMGSDSKWKVSANSHFARHKCDPFMEWLDRLPDWDGKARLDGLLERLFEVDYRGAGQQEKEYIRFCSRFLPMGVVMRTYHPGCKLDEVLVLCGPQGSGKSSFAEWLLPSREYFTDDIQFGAKSDDQKRRESMQGRVIVEFSEMAGVQSYMVNMVKAFLSRGTDACRLPYATLAEDYPRRCVFIATSNDSGALPADPTGNRRFLPVDVMLRKREGLSEEENYRAAQSEMDGLREQIWAEAMHRVLEMGESLFVTRELGRWQEVQTLRHVHVSDVYEDLPMVLRGMWGMKEQAERAGKPYFGLTTGQMLEAMGMDPEDHRAKIGLGKALKNYALEKSPTYPRPYNFTEDFDPRILPDDALHPPKGGYVGEQGGDPGPLALDGGRLDLPEDPPY